MLCLSSSSSSSSSSFPSSAFTPHPLRRRFCCGIAVSSSHSNSKILKSNRRSLYGRRISPYDDDDDGDSDEDDEESELSDDDPSVIEEFGSERGSKEKCLKHRSTVRKKRADKNKLLEGWEDDSSKSDRTLPNNINIQDSCFATYRSIQMDHVDLDSKVNLKNVKYTVSKYKKLIEELDFDEKWFPLIYYLSTFGLKESHFISIYERHMPCLQINLASAQERLEFLISVGVQDTDVKRILVRQPQILEYTVENNLKSHIAFLESIGVPHSRIGQIITAAPSLFSYSVEHSLKPTIRYLIEEVGIKESDVSKVVQLSPQILVQRLDNSWTSRFCFFSKELGAPRDSIVKMVTKHPQLLHYSIEDGISPRINFLRSIGMRNTDIVKVLTSLAQVLSLSLEKNLRPKYLYLVNELGNEVESLTKYPMYLSLSLDQRIRPRHRFLVSMKKAPKGPFPLSSFVPTDECFCQQWAGTSLDKYLAFRQSLLLTDFAAKYRRKG